MFVLFCSLIFGIVTTSCSAPQRANRETAALHLQIGTGYLTKGLYPQAMSELTIADNLDPNNSTILNNLGLAYFVRGRYVTAEEKFRKAIKLAPKFSDAKVNLARLFVDVNQPKEAIPYLLEVESDLTYDVQEKTFSTMGMAYFAMGQYQKAEEYLLRSLAIRRDNCTTANFYGRTLYELKRLKQSATALDQAIDYCRSSRFEEPIYFSAMSYFTLGDKEKTKARIEELLKDYPKSKYVAKAKGMLELLQQ